MAIDFKQVAAPSFADSNALLKLAAEQGQGAFDKANTTWDNAGAAVQNANEAKMMQLLNSYSREQLEDPNAQAFIAKQFEDIAGPTGGIYDPKAMGVLAAGQGDVLQKRQLNDYAEQAANIGVQDDQVNLAGKRADQAWTEGERGFITGEREQAQDYSNALDMYSQSQTAIRDVIAQHTGPDGELTAEGAGLKATIESQMNGLLTSTFGDKLTPAFLGKVQDGYFKRFQENQKLGLTNESIASTINTQAAGVILGQDTLQFNRDRNESAISVEQARMDRDDNRFDRTQGLKEAQFGLDVSKFDLKSKEGRASAVKAMDATSEKANFPAGTLRADGTVDGAVASASLTTKLSMNTAALANPPGSGDFNETIQTKIAADIKSKAITTNQRDGFLSTMVLFDQGKGESGDSTALTPRQKNIVYNAMVMKQIPSKNFIGRGAEGKLKKAIPAYLNWHENVGFAMERDLSNQKLIAENLKSMEDNFKISGSEAAKQMGIMPGHEYFPMLPPHIRENINNSLAAEYRDFREFNKGNTAFNMALTPKEAAALKYVRYNNEKGAPKTPYRTGENAPTNKGSKFVDAPPGTPKPTGKVDDKKASRNLKALQKAAADKEVAAKAAAAKLAAEQASLARRTISPTKQTPVIRKQPPLNITPKNQGSFRGKGGNVLMGDNVLDRFRTR